jgi:hypothetical protein
MTNLRVSATTAELEIIGTIRVPMSLLAKFCAAIEADGVFFHACTQTGEALPVSLSRCRKRATTSSAVYELPAGTRVTKLSVEEDDGVIFVGVVWVDCDGNAFDILGPNPGVFPDSLDGRVFKTRYSNCVPSLRRCNV